MSEVAAPVAAAPQPAAPAAPAAKPAVPAPAPAKPPEPTTPEEFFELNISGKKEKRSWNDPNTRKAAIEALQKKGFAEKSTTEARNLYKALTQRETTIAQALSQARQGDPSALIETLGLSKEAAAKDPTPLLKALGINHDEYLRAQLAQKLELSGMTPEQRRIAELEAKNAEHERKLQSVSEARRQERVAAKAKQQQAQLIRELSAASERAGIEPDERTLYAVWEVMNEFHAGGVPMAPDIIIEEAKERIEGTFKRLEEQALKGLKGPALVQRLGPEIERELRAHFAQDPEVMKQVRAALVAKVRGGQKLDAAAPSPPPAPAPGDGSKYVAPVDFDEKIRQLAKGFK